MSKAILLVGFDNWGKSSLIKNGLFNIGTHRILTRNQPYRIASINAEFFVQEKSNDDLGENEYVRIMQTINPSNSTHLFSTLCPTRESINKSNDSRRILLNGVFSTYQNIYLFLLKYKWDYHAELIIDSIQNYYSNLGSRFIFRTINADDGYTDDSIRLQRKTEQIITELRQIFP